MKNLLFLIAIIFSASAISADHTVIDTLLAAKHFRLQEDQPAECPQEFTVEMDEKEIRLQGLLARALPVALVNEGETKIEASGNFFHGFRATTLTVKAKHRSLEVIEVRRKDFIKTNALNTKYLKIKTIGDGAIVQIDLQKCFYSSR